MPLCSSLKSNNNHLNTQTWEHLKLNGWVFTQKLKFCHQFETKSTVWLTVHSSKYLLLCSTEEKYSRKLQICNNMRVNKWWNHDFIFGWTIHLKQLYVVLSIFEAYSNLSENHCRKYITVVSVGKKQTTEVSTPSWFSTDILR